MLKDYLLLFRLPNLFTVPSNIMAGYFSVASSSTANLSNLALLIMSSVLLYISGIVFNDYSDIEIDRRERPFRPLPSGKVPKRTAFIAATISMVVANFLAFMVSTLSFTIVIILSLIVLSYDFRLKQTVAGPVIMGTARTINVLFGSSAILTTGMLLSYTLPQLRLTVVSISAFLYVVSISLLSKMEIGPKRSRLTLIGPFILIFGVIAIIVIASLFRIFHIELILSLVLFVGIISITCKQTVSERSSMSIQRAIKILVLSIIVLDSIFISGTVGLIYGLSTLLLIIPSIFLARKLYVT
jgi:4-hydroxybenzoate polyprenyltransferase